MLLLHGFPEFWWTWRHQLVTLAEAGYRAVAVDLRGYGGSDKPPRGYDLITAAADAAGLIRALGEANATVVGHDWGGLTAWTLAAYFPKAVRRLAVVSMAHPLRMRARVLSSPFTISRALPAGRPGRRGGYPLAFQVPMLPERRLVRDDGALVGQILSSWSAPGWPDQETVRVYQRAMRIPPVAHTSLEYHRWFVRSTFRPDGLRYARALRSPGRGADAAPARRRGPVHPAAGRPGRGRYVEGPYRWKVIDGRGPLPARGATGAPSTPSCWLAKLTPSRSGERAAPPGPGRTGRAANARPRRRARPPAAQVGGGRTGRAVPDDLGSRRPPRQRTRRPGCSPRAGRSRPTRCSRRRGSPSPGRIGTCGGASPRSPWASPTRAAATRAGAVTLLRRGAGHARASSPGQPAPTALTSGFVAARRVRSRWPDRAGRPGRAAARPTCCCPLRPWPGVSRRPLSAAAGLRAAAGSCSTSARTCWPWRVGGSPSVGAVSANPVSGCRRRRRRRRRRRAGRC